MLVDNMGITVLVCSINSLSDFLRVLCMAERNFLCTSEAKNEPLNSRTVFKTSNSFRFLSLSSLFFHSTLFFFHSPFLHIYMGLYVFVCERAIHMHSSAFYVPYILASQHLYISASLYPSIPLFSSQPPISAFQFQF